MSNLATVAAVADRAAANAARSFRSAFERAEQARTDEIVDERYQIASQRIRLCVVGRELATTFGRPLRHLRLPANDPADPDLTIRLWDQSVTGIGPPLESEPEALGRTWEAEGGVLTAAADSRLIRYARPSNVSWLDRAARALIGCYRSAAAVSIFEQTRPFRLLSTIWNHDRAVQVVHCGLVARGGRGVLIGGPGGAGKSTLSLLALNAGFSFLGDDFVGLSERVEGTFNGYSFYSTCRLEPTHLRRLGPLGELGIPSDDPIEEKSLLFLAEHFPERMLGEIPITAVVLPRQAAPVGGRARLARSPEALLRLAPSSIRLGISAGTSGLERLSRLTRQVPCYWLDLSGELEEIPGLLDEVLERSGS